ncbi:MAG: histidinol phosphate phosphatase domain-containing protein [Bacillota bacterium]|jgi:histidinol phosphatase-like PHP family hydrolase
MVYDFHTHTFLSDGELSPVELIRRAVVNGYRAIGVTDHAGPGNLERVLKEIIQECWIAEQYWDIRAIPGVELTHVPAAAIAALAQAARDYGAELVVVHGETLVEPVEPGTNLAAAACREVDILAHPGLLSREAAERAAQNGIFIEVTARSGHNVGNGQVVRMAQAVGASLLVDSDAHASGDLLTENWARTVARGAGLDKTEIETVTVANPKRLLERIGKQRRR